MLGDTRRAYALRVVIMLVTTIDFWLRVFRSHFALVRADGALLDVDGWWKLFRFLWISPGGMRKLARPWLDYFRRDFHPGSTTTSTTCAPGSPRRDSRKNPYTDCAEAQPIARIRPLDQRNLSAVREIRVKLLAIKSASDKAVPGCICPESWGERMMRAARSAAILGLTIHPWSAPRHRYAPRVSSSSTAPSR